MELKKEIALIKEDKEIQAEMKIFKEASLVDLANSLEDEDSY